MKKTIMIFAAAMILFCFGCGGKDNNNSKAESSAASETSVLSAEPSAEESCRQEKVSSETASESELSRTAEYKQIPQTEAVSIMESKTGYIILDVRTFSEFYGGHIPGAICVPNENITDKMPPELPDKHQLILIYCRSGNRSKQAAQKLADMGYDNILEFGGIIDWQGEIVTE